MCYPEEDGFPFHSGTSHHLRDLSTKVISGLLVRNKGLAQNACGLGSLSDANEGSPAGVLPA